MSEVSDYLIKSDLKLKELQSRRAILEGKTQLRQATILEFDRVRKESIHRTIDSLEAQRKDAIKRHEVLRADISRSLHDMQDVGKINSIKLTQAKEMYKKKVDELLPLWKKRQAIHLEEKMKQIQRERAAVEERREKFQMEFRREEKIKEAFEAERRQLVVSLMQEHYDHIAASVKDAKLAADTAALNDYAKIRMEEVEKEAKAWTKAGYDSEYMRSKAEEMMKEYFPVPKSSVIPASKPQHQEVDMPPLPIPMLPSKTSSNANISHSSEYPGTVKSSTSTSVTNRNIPPSPPINPVSKSLDDDENQGLIPFTPPKNMDESSLDYFQNNITETSHALSESFNNSLTLSMSHTPKEITPKGTLSKQGSESRVKVNILNERESVKDGSSEALPHSALKMTVKAASLEESDDEYDYSQDSSVINKSHRDNSSYMSPDTTYHNESLNLNSQNVKESSISNDTKIVTSPHETPKSSFRSTKSSNTEDDEFDINMESVPPASKGDDLKIIVPPQSSSSSHSLKMEPQIIENLNKGYKVSDMIGALKILYGIVEEANLIQVVSKFKSISSWNASMKDMKIVVTLAMTPNTDMSDQSLDVIVQTILEIISEYSDELLPT